MLFKNNKGSVKGAFDRVRQDIFTLGSEINSIKQDILDLKSLLYSIENDINKLKITSTYNENTSTHPVNSTDTSTVPYEIEGLKYPNLNSSIGNEGASTDRQTVRQTDNYTEKPIKETISEASEMLESLDGLKKKIRLKFKSLTQQEMLVFSTIYQFQEQGIEEIDYTKISSKLGLSQSSIRDYVQRIINKGVSIEKTKINNKKIVLRIPSELTKIASLDTISKLREI